MYINTILQYASILYNEGLQSSELGHIHLKYQCIFSNNNNLRVKKKQYYNDAK